MAQAMYKIAFKELFQENPDGSLSPKKIIKIGNVVFGPGTAFGPGVEFGGVNFFELKGKDLAVKQTDGTVVYHGYYQNQ